MLREYASYLRANHLSALAREHLRLAKALDVPMLRFCGHMGDDELVKASETSMAALLDALIEGRFVAEAEASLRRWEADDLPGIARDQLAPGDLVLVDAAQKGALLSLVDAFTQQADAAMVVVRALEALFVEKQNARIQFYARLQRQTEAKLAEGEQQLRHLAEIVRSSEDAIYGKAPDGTILSWNPAAERLYGYSAGEVLGRSIAMLVPPEERSQLPALLGRVTAGESVRYFECERVRKDGTRISVSLSLSPIRDAAGRVTGISTIARDITERKLLARRLEEREAQLSLAQQVAHLGSWSWDAATDTVSWSDEMYRLFGLVPGAIVPSMETTWQLMHPEDREEALRRSNEALEAGGRWRMVFRVVLPDGSLRYLRGQGEAVRAADGTLERMFGTSQDVTEAVQAELALRKSESKFRAVFEKADMGIVIVDAEGQLMAVNPALEAMVGYSASEIAERGLDGLTHPEDVATDQAMFAEVLQGRRDSYALEKRYLRKDGSLIWGHVTVTVVQSTPGAPGFLVSMVQDVTDEKLAKENGARHVNELREANRQLQESDRYKDEFLSVISHELRTPLNFIMGFASILDDEIQGTLTPEQHVSLGKILSGSERMMSLVNSLLDYSRIQAGKLQVEPEPTPYAPLVAEVVETMRPLAARKQITLATDPGVDAIAVLDGVRVVQVLTNLLDNAIKFTPEGGEIVVRTRQDGDAILTEVSDSGLGIAEADQAKLFNRFRQLDMSSTRKAGGTGLGLAIAKALVEAHGGSIGVRSNPGDGATFWYRLPLEVYEPAQSR